MNYITISTNKSFLDDLVFPVDNQLLGLIIDEWGNEIQKVFRQQRTCIFRYSTWHISVSNNRDAVLFHCLTKYGQFAVATSLADIRRRVPLHGSGGGRPAALG